MDIAKGEGQQIQINTTDELSRGRYANSMIVGHGPEEFTIDWLVQAHNGTFLVARIVVTPGHMKRIVKALEENLFKYEHSFGEIRTIEPPPTMVQ